MLLDRMTHAEIEDYLDKINQVHAGSVTVVLTDGTMLTGRCKRGVLGDPMLEAQDQRYIYVVDVPSDRVAGIYEQTTTNPSGLGLPCPEFLVEAAEQADLDSAKIKSFGFHRRRAVPAR